MSSGGPVQLPTSALGQALLAATLLGASTLTVMSGATIAPALPAIAEHFKSLPDARFLTQLSLTVPALFIVLASPLAGYLADKSGPKPVLAVSAVIYILAGSSGLFLDGLIDILIGRALLGVSVAGILTAAISLIGGCYEGHRRNRILGWQSAAMSLGGVIYITAGGFLADFGWRLPFAIYAVPVILLPTLFFLVPDIRERQDAEAREAAGDIPWKLFALAYGAAFVVILAYYVIPVQLPFLLLEIGAPEPSTAALTIACASLTSAVVASLYGRIRQVLSGRASITLTFLLVGAGLTVVGSAAGLPAVVGGMILSGAGLGLMFPALVGLILEDAAPHIRGRASSGLTMAVFLAQFLSPVVMAAVAGGGTAEWFSLAGQGTLAVGAALVAWFVWIRARRAG